MAFDGDACAGMPRVEAVEDADRNTLPERGKNRLVVQHLRTVVGELRRLAVGNLRQRSGLGNLGGIRGHDSVDVSPDPHLVGVERSPDDRRGIVRASASKRRYYAVD